MPYLSVCLWSHPEHNYVPTYSKSLLTHFPAATGITIQNATLVCLFVLTPKTHLILILILNEQIFLSVCGHTQNTFMFLLVSQLA